MSDQSSRLLTVGRIAQSHSQPLHRVEYVIRARKIEPIAWAGNARVFSAEAAELIGKALGNSVEQGFNGTEDAAAESVGGKEEL